MPAVDHLLRDLTPQVLGVLIRRGADFAAAEDAVQEAMIEALRHWPDEAPDDPRAWLIRVAGRKLIDAQRSETARRRREERFGHEPEPGPTEQGDDTLVLLSRCCHRSLSPGSAIALTLRAVGGLTTRQIAASTHDPEVGGLLALMLLHHARRAARRTASGEIVALAEQDRSLRDTTMIAEGVAVLRRALARDRLGEYQAQAAIAALHDDAAGAEETDWTQILEWYDELVRLSDSPVVRLNRAVALGEVDGPLAGLRALKELDAGLPRRDAAAAYLHERAGDLAEAARLYADAARAATNEPERHHLTKQAARLNAALRSG